MSILLSFFMFIFFLFPDLSYAGLLSEPSRSSQKFESFWKKIENSPLFLTEQQKNIKNNKLKKFVCVSKELGVRYFCHPDWSRRDIEGAILTIISSEPSVTLTITKMDTDITYIEQLTKEMLRKKALYADTFQMDQVQFANTKALQVKAFSRQYSGRRLLDYYFMRNGELYAVLFSVFPKEKWDDYKFLIKKIKDSFELIEPSSQLTKTKG